MEDRRKGYVRYPLTLYVDSIEERPEIHLGETIRTAYDLEITEYDMKKLRDIINKRLNEKVISPIRIRVVGRLVS